MTASTPIVDESIRNVGVSGIALNANFPARYSEAFSFLVETQDQAESDYYWNALTADGGKEQPCGWLTD